MPLEGARYRWRTFQSGKKVRLAFRDNAVIEAKASSGKVHTPAEFAAEKRRKPAPSRSSVAGYRTRGKR